ncbi:hypothetical protein ABKN59_000824 [Abortiporus biennis]
MLTKAKHRSQGHSISPLDGNEQPTIVHSPLLLQERQIRLLACQFMFVTVRGVRNVRNQGNILSLVLIPPANYTPAMSNSMAASY